MVFKFIWLGFVVVVTCQASPLNPSHLVHEKRDDVHKAWTKRDRIYPRDIFPMRIGLTQQNLKRAHNLLMDVSDPSSPNYAKYWSQDEVVEMFAPSTDTTSLVKEWLTSSGIIESRLTITDNRAWIAFDATVEEAESLLQTEYFEYHNNEHGTITAACDEYKIPVHLRDHIDYITPGIRLSNLIERRKIERRTNDDISAFSPHFKPAPPIDSIKELSTCDSVVTPECVAALYQVPPATKAHPENSMGVFERGDFWSATSLDLYFANFTPKIPQGTRPINDTIDLIWLEFREAGEADLDIQVAYPLVHPQNITVFQTDDVYYSGFWWHAGRGLFNTFLDAIDGSYCTYSAFGETGDDPNIDPVYPNNNSICSVCGTQNNYKGKTQCGIYQPTNVISFSYGAPESEYPGYYMQRQCNEFLKLGLQGVSIIVSSGDKGVAEATGCLGANQTIFSPGYPANCPYVTTVGATQILPGHSVHDPESAVHEDFDFPFNSSEFTYTSGGGFSNLFPAPAYQGASLDRFFSDHNPPYPYYSGNDSFAENGGVYNRAGRGIPDVAANGLNLATVVQNKFTLSGGTSASAPIFAAIINRINEERLAVGKRTVGFINPVLYKNPSVLNDITNGSNPNCGTDGFQAVKGWDPVTGLGTPNWPKMVELFLSLP